MDVLEQRTLVYRAGDWFVMCYPSPGGHGAAFIRYADVAPRPPADVRAFSYSDTPGRPFRVYGLVGADVRSVEFIQPDGTKATAKLTGNFFNATWTGRFDGTKARATLADGSIVDIAWGGWSH